MKIVLSLCCVMLAMLLHPITPKNQSGSSFRTLNLQQGDIGYSYFESMAITSSEDFKAFLDEISQQAQWYNRQQFVDTLLSANIDFNKEALVLLRPDGASGVTFATPVLQDKTLFCEFRKENVATIDVAIFNCIALAVSKSLVDKVELTTMLTFPDRRGPATILSTTERQPWKMRRDPPPPPKPLPGECPKLILGCPTDVLETGKTYEAKLIVEGGNVKDDGNFNWSVTGAQIVGGQGTRSVSMRINQPNKIVEVWVSLGGINPHCNAVTNCSAGPTR